MATRINLRSRTSIHHARLSFTTSYRDAFFVFIVFCTYVHSSTLLAGPLNPTGRDILISMPLMADGVKLGELMMQLTKDDNIALDSNRFLQIATPYVNSDHQAELEMLTNTTPMFSKALLEGYGYQLFYDPGLLQLSVIWPAKFKSIRHLGGLQSHNELNTTAKLPETTSAYINLFTGITRSNLTNGGDIDHSLALQGAVSLPSVRHITFESEALMDNNKQLTRQGTRVVFDEPIKNRRWKAGDVVSDGFSYLGSQEMLGVNLSQNLSTFRLDQQIVRPTGRTSFFLERDSIVRILVNGELESEQRLTSGPYQLDQFPINYGSNRVVIEIEDDTGIRDRLVFNLFSDNQFLAHGQTELSFGAGTKRQAKNNSIDYSKDPIASGYYRRGITQGLTFSGFSQLTQKISLTGAEALVAVPFGRLSLESAVSKDKEGGKTEYAFNAGWSFFFPKSASHRSKNLFLGAGYSSDFFNRSSSDLGNTNRTTARIDYNQSLKRNWAIGVNFQRDRDHDETRKTYSGVHLDYNRRDFRLRVTFEHNSVDNEADETQLALKLQYRFDRQESFAISVSNDQSYTASYQLSSKRNGVGALGLALDVSTDDSEHQTAGIATHYEGNRAELVASHRIDLPENNGKIGNFSSLNIGSAIAYADGKFAIGRPIKDSFVIFSTHENLGERKAYIDTDQLDNHSASSGFFGPALYSRPQSYSHLSIGYDLDDLPLGYNLGDGLASIYPTYRSGYHEVIGSNATVTAIGKLMDDNGDPAKLLTGIAEPVEAETTTPQSIFTNSTGRFSAQGLSPGKWKITLNRKESQLIYVLYIPDKTVGLLRAGSLKPYQVRK